MKRFVVFAYYSYSSGVGLSGCMGAFESLEEARLEVKKIINGYLVYDRFEIVEITEDGLRLVEES